MPPSMAWRRCVRFNTQPPEGGWNFIHHCLANAGRFNTQPPEGGWQMRYKNGLLLRGFNTQPPEGGWNYYVNDLFVKELFQHTAA